MSIGNSVRGRVGITLLVLLSLPLLAMGQPAPDASRDLNQAAIESLREGKLDDALRTIQQALARNADDPEALNTEGRILREQGRVDEAISSFEKAVALKPDFAGALTNLADVLAARGDTGRARALREKAAQILTARGAGADPAPTPSTAGSEAAVPAAASQPDSEPLQFAVQVAAYESRDTALELAKELSARYAYSALVDPLVVRGKTVYRVRLRVPSRQDAETLSDRLRRERNLQPWIVAALD